jgi:tetratricopeptide (TPR) repeat protein
MRQLSVFAGGWTLEAAQSVCDGDILSLLNSLVIKSLVVMNQRTNIRYSFHETIRQYAHEKLLEAGGAEVLRQKHLSYYVKFAEQAEPELYRSNQVFWWDKLRAELDNIRLAMRWALTTGSKLGLELIINSADLWIERGEVHEIQRGLAQLLEQYHESDALRARALVVCGDVLATTGDLAQAQLSAEQGLELARSISDRHAEADGLRSLGVVIALQGHLRQAIPMVEQSVALYESLEDKLGQAAALYWLAIDHNDSERSKVYIEETLRLYRELGHLSGIAYCLHDLGQTALWQNDFSSAIRWLEEARTIFCELGNRSGEAVVLNTFGILAYWQSDYEQACAYLERAITLFEKLGSGESTWSRTHMAYALLRQGDLTQAKEMFQLGIQDFQKGNSVIGLIFTIEGVASLNTDQGQTERAARLFAWTDVMREKIGDHRPTVEQDSVDKDLAVIHAKLNYAEFAEVSEEGRVMTVEQAIALALETVEEM